MKTAEELVRIVSFGGGIDIDASSFSTPELVRIASFSKENKGPKIIFRGIGGRPTEELVRIASFGHRNVVFEF